MDFLEMNFSTLFLEKHGKDVFNSIIEQIQLENSSQYSKDYVEVVFKIALWDFWGLNENEIKKILKNIMPDQKINAREIKVIHKESIDKIGRCLKSELEKFNIKK